MTFIPAARLIDAIRCKLPGLARKADHENSRTAAIHLYCIECSGGSRSEAVRCDSTSCPLWLYRPGADGTPRPAGMVPTVEEYEALVTAKFGGRMEDLRARGAAMHAAKDKTDDAEVDPFEGIE